MEARATENEVRRKKNSTSSFFSLDSTNSEFPGLNDAAPDSTSATECDNTETGL